MITETRSKKDLMRGGGLCYLHFHRTLHIHCNRFSIFCSPAHCPLSPKDQSPLEQNHFASIQKVLSRWYKRQALIRDLTASRFHWTTKRGVNWTVTLLGLIRIGPARTTSCPVFLFLIFQSIFNACFPYYRIYKTLSAYKESRYNRHYQHKCKNGCNRPKTPIDPKLLNWREKKLVSI